MTKRVISGKVSTGSAHEATLPHEKPLFFVYNPSTATKRSKNARNTEENGPYGQVFAISMTFFRTMNLTGPKTAKISNKGLQPTTHKLSAMHNELLATHQSGIVRGSRLNPDVRVMIHKTIPNLSNRLTAISNRLTAIFSSHILTAMKLII